jgi:RNA polymerase sigma-70 factor, ECF subfamily
MPRVGRAEIQVAMTRLADGDRSATAALVAALWPVLCAFARRAVGDADDAEDIAQESLIKIAARIADFDTSRDGLSWAFAIASFEVKSHLKRISRRREIAGSTTIEEMAHEEPSPEGRVLDEEVEQTLRQSLARLTSADLQTLASSAAVMPPALRKRRQRALARLRAVWRELYG